MLHSTVLFEKNQLSLSVCGAPRASRLFYVKDGVYASGSDENFEMWQRKLSFLVDKNNSKVFTVLSTKEPFQPEIN